jgi:CrcB protein
MLAGLIASGHLPMRTHWREFVFVGILRGLTTFSAFGLDTITFLRAGDTAKALSNIAIQVVGGLAAVYAGLVLSERLGPSVR